MAQSVEPVIRGSRYSLGQWIALIYLVAITAPALWALTGSQFVPSPLGERVTLAAAFAALAAAGLHAVLDPAFAKGGAYLPTLLTRAPVMANMPTRVVVFAAVAFALTYIGVQKGVLEWWSWVAATPGERTLTVSRWSGGGGLGCAGYSFREAPFLIGPALCTRGAAGGARPPGTPIQLFGRVTPMGIDVRSFHVDTSD